MRRLITYAAEPGGRVPAYLLIPRDVLAGKKKAAAILCLHGTDNVVGHGTVVGLGKNANRAYALELAKRGYVTLAPNYPLLAKYQPDLKRLGWESGTLKAVWDNLRGLDLLAALPFVDAAKGFGAIGHSLGGHNAVYTAVFDDRIKAVVSSCGLDSYLDYFNGDQKNWDPERGWCQTRYMRKLADYKGRLADIPFDFHEMIGALAPRHVFLIAPKKDSNFRADSVDRIAAAARPIFKLYGHEDRLRIEHPDGGHDFPPEMRDAAYRLFDAVLKGDGPRRKKALIIGIDGCRPDALLVAKAPQLHGLIKQGAFSDKAQTGDMTASGSGWGSLLTGVWREKHGVRGNDFKLANFGEFPDLLTRIKKARPVSFVASVVHWDPIQKLIIKKADVNAAYKTDAQVATAACKLLGENKLDLLFIHFDDVDGAGHKYGFDPMQPRYLAAIAQTDDYVGALLHALAQRPSYAQEDWLIVVSTDHGGSGKGHGLNIPAHRTIFLIVSGPSAARGTIEPVPGIVDVAPTVLQHLGVSIDARWRLDGKAVGLKAVAQRAP